MTKKQKEERAAAELRRQALLSSGVHVEGLQQPSDSPATGVKKVVYSNRKKKPVTTETPSPSPSSPAPLSRPLTPEPETLSGPAKESASKCSGVKDDWDASSDEDSKPSVQPSVKDAWDDSSEEEVTPQKPEVHTPTKPTVTPKASKEAPKPAGNPLAGQS